MAPLPIRIERKSPLPIHVQLDAQLRQLVAAGILGPGMRLPAVRQMAASLGVNRNTVQRVYQALERAGILETRSGKGTLVATTAGARANRDVAHRRLRSLVREILGLGFDPAEVVTVVQAEAIRLEIERAQQAEGLVVSRHRFASWGRYRSRGSASEP